MLTRRRLLVSIAPALVAGVGLATPAVALSRAQQLVVVKALLFTCGLCRATEAYDAAIEKAARFAGGRMVHAPLPLELAARERMYYALRDMYPAWEARVRAALYAGTQDAGVSLNDAVQVMVWLQTTLPLQSGIDWAAVVEAAEAAPARQAAARAARLAVSAPVSDTPAYVLLRGSDVLDVFDPPRVNGSLGALREAVIEGVRKHSANRSQKD